MKPEDFIAPGLSAGGSIAASAVGYASARRSEAFQERMSNTSHQREVKDLKEAGLNPILSAAGGGSSTPQGAVFTPDNPFSNLQNDLSSAKNARTQEKVGNETAEKLIRDQAVSTATKEKMLQDTLQQAELFESQKKKLAAEILSVLQQSKESSAREASIRAEMPKKTLINKGIDSANNIVDQFLETPLGKALIDPDNAAKKVKTKIGDKLRRYGKNIRARSQAKEAMKALKGGKRN